MKALAEPTRTCVGCRKRSAKRELVRVVAGDGKLIPDLEAREKGRGAYVHGTVECLELALRRKAFPRALRQQGSLDSSCLAEVIRQAEPG